MKKVLTAMVITVAMISCAKEHVGDNSAATTTTTTSDLAAKGSNDNNAKPPQAVLTSFTAKFGNVPVSEWKLRSDGTWRAHFIRNGVAWEATFTASGTLVKSERA